MVTTNKKIRIHIISLVVILALMLSSIYVFAGTTTFVQSGVGNGKTVFWRPANNAKGWYIAKNTNVKLYIALSTAEKNVNYGTYHTSAGTYNKFASFSGTSTSTTTKKITANDTYHKAYVTNNSVGTITVKNSSYISF